ncbi:RluA family pseudouridine synthase [Algibacillus agarilyticus]|uniref:RluA family pseudouridine synthase n=1 Tax=Algibacillus agarilyticus TaxID=2234133 RepID=UPI000DD05F34|nr:RluA family pseudouridine synthase [Algibacillus agarilyticus]
MPETVLSKSKIVDDFIAPACDQPVTILYQDEDILLIDKPSGLLSLSGKNPLNWDSVHYRLLKGQKGISPAFPHAKLPHRLDFGTSGIMVVGLNAASSAHLNKQFQARTVNKRYIAVLEGWLEHDQGQISATIAKDPTIFPRVKICEVTGKTAVSEYKLLQKLDADLNAEFKMPRRSVVQYKPLTGRTHQLRIHSYYIGHAILGCDLYKSEGSEQLAKRLLLHASELEFIHPTQGKVVTGVCPCPFYEA